MAIQRTIAVLGSEGQLGGELVRQLGAAAIPLTRRDCDLGDLSVTRSVLLHLAPAAVINAAGYTQVDRAEQEERECLRINAQAVERLATICGELSCPLVQVSTDYVFGADRQRRSPYRELDPPGPQGVYARSKLAGEQAAATWERHVIVRTCGLYGPRAKPTQSNFVDTMLRLGRERDVLRVVNDQRCTPTYVRNVAQGILFLVEHRHYGLFHVVNGGSTTWYDFAVEIFRLAGITTPIEPISTAQYGARAPRPAYSVLDTTKYHSLGGPPMPPWQCALADYLAMRGMNR
ncbi:MAG: dTDP-4-dehydrorhamnose reductase [Pirellulales bacterium]